MLRYLPLQDKYPILRSLLLSSEKKDPAAAMITYSRYMYAIKRSTGVSLVCPMCNEDDVRRSPVVYRTHVYTIHKLRKKSICVWCLRNVLDGAMSHLDHQYPCFLRRCDIETFCVSSSPPPPRSLVGPTTTAAAHDSTTSAIEPSDHDDDRVVIRVKRELSETELEGGGEDEMDDGCEKKRKRRTKKRMKTKDDRSEPDQVAVVDSASAPRGVVVVPSPTMAEETTNLKWLVGVYQRRIEKK
ncbi:bromodomain-containing protein 7-like protein, partial [Lasius niger]